MKALFLVFATFCAGAAFAQSNYAYAPVRSSIVLQERVATTKQVCETRTVQREIQGETSYGNAVLGAVVGGSIGSLFGQGDGKLLATAIGAGAGSVLGHKNDRQGATTVEQVPVTDCKDVVSYEDRIKGYRVTYEYQGQLYETTLPRDPGSTLKIAVSISPVGY